MLRAFSIDRARWATNSHCWMVTLRQTFLISKIALKEKEEAFDALVIATGARAVHLPLNGFDLPGVHVLRELTDGAAIKQMLSATTKKAVIIGAGYIGMEMAHVLTERGLAVTVVEKMPQILPGWHDDTVEAVEETLGKRGVEVRTGITVTSAEARKDGRVAAVLTDDGRFKADLVLVAAGIRPNIELASSGGLRIGDTGAIWVSQNQQTSHDSVWAAGDCSEAYHRVLRRNAWIPLGTTANKQGRIAGANVVGAGQRFAGIVGTAGFVVFDLEVARTGLGEEQAKIEGFDPVAYFSEGRPVEGSKKFGTRWMGANWRFASAENRDRFVAEPERFAPQYGGYCAYAVSQGGTAGIDPEAWSIVDGKLYLNLNLDIQARWDADRDRYIGLADENWPGLRGES